MTVALASALSHLKALVAGPLQREFVVEFVSPRFFYEFFAKEALENWEGGPPEVGPLYVIIGLFYLAVLVFFLWRFRYLQEVRSGWVENRRRRAEVRRRKAERRRLLEESAASVEGVSYDAFHALATANRAFDQGLLEEALGAYEEASRLGPPLSAAWVGRGAALGRLGRLEEAREAFGRALEIAPSNVEALVNLGLSALASGDEGEARKALETALELDGASARGYLGQALLAARLGERAVARESLQRALSLSPSLAEEAAREPALSGLAPEVLKDPS